MYFRFVFSISFVTTILLSCSSGNDNSKRTKDTPAIDSIDKKEDLNSEKLHAINPRYIFFPHCQAHTQRLNALMLL